MGKKSRPASDGNKAPAAPVPLKADSPAAPAEPGIEAPTKADSKARTAGAELAIEAQVDALLEQAQQQVQTMTELVNEPVPEPESQPERQPETPSSRAKPVDAAELQSQVDAILAQAAQDIAPPDEPAEDADNEVPPASVPVASETKEPVAGQPGQGGLIAAPAQVNLAEIDAVIADAAQRAMQADEFDTEMSAAEQLDAPLTQPPVPASAPAPPTSAPDSRAPAAKGGQTPSRQEKSAHRTAPDARPANQTAPAAEAHNPLDADSKTPAKSQHDQRLNTRLARLTLQSMAAINAPWHSWSNQTRYAVLGLTFLNVVLATAAYYILLRRWF